jgi:hypothetical protein
MHTHHKTLSLTPGSYGTFAQCSHVDFIPNVFLGRTRTFKTEIQWDNLLKLGEHEDFFLRAKDVGIKTLTCPGVTFVHDQVDFWLRRDAYEVKRSRIFDFWRLSLRKHGLNKLNSFGHIMMDLVGTCTLHPTSRCGSRFKYREINDSLKISEIRLGFTSPVLQDPTRRNGKQDGILAICKLRKRRGAL